MGEYKITAKYGTNRSRASGEAGDHFARFDDFGGIFFSASIRDKMVGWRRVDYYIDDEKRLFTIKRNDTDGLYAAYVGKQAKVCGLCPAKLAGAEFRKRYPAQISDDTITIAM